jgi:hypothetical protein
VAACGGVVKKWGVTLPVSGSIYVEVEAANAKEAIDKALREGEWDDQDLQWEVHQQITSGNVFHGMQNSAEAEDLGEDEE